MRENIRKTLLARLFERPRPLSASLFRESAEFLFPAREEFIRFLKIESEQERIQAAKHIINALHRGVRFGPPVRLLQNLLTYEQSRSGAHSEEYVAQDHYVHLVNLYLTGLYFFSHHRGIHNQCRAAIRLLKQRALARIATQDNRAASIVQGMNEYRIFGLLWVYFVLYHDIGYPLEGASPTERSEFNDVLKPFKNLTNSLLKDITAKTLSNLLAVDFILTDEDALLLRDLLGTSERYVLFSKQGEKADDLLNAFHIPPEINGPLNESAVHRLLASLGGATHFTRINSGHAVRLVSSLIPDANICAVLAERTTGEPLVLVVRGDEAAFGINTARASRAILRRKLPELLESAFGTGNPPSQSTEWLYFILDARAEFERVLSTFHSSEVSAADFAAEYGVIKTHIANSVPVHSLLASGSIGAFEASRRFYWELHRALAEVEDGEPGSELTELFRVATRQFGNIADEFPKHAGDCLGRVVAGEIKQKRGIDVFDELTGSTTSELQIAFKRFFTRLAPQVADCVVQGVGHKMEATLKQVRSARECHMVLSSLVSGEISLDVNADEEVETAINPLVTVPFASATSIHSATLESVSEGVEIIDRQLIGIGFCPLERILATYHPEFKKHPSLSDTERVFLDHGLTASLVLLGCRAFFQRCSAALAGEPGAQAAPGIRAIRVALGLGSAAQDHALSFEFQEILPTVAHMVALHNLYPSGLPGYEGYRTSLRRDPLCFVAMLADGLQLWDRPKLLNLGHQDLPPTIRASGFDIRVEETGISLVFEGTEFLFGKLAQYRQALDSYMSGASSMVHLRSGNRSVR